MSELPPNKNSIIVIEHLYKHFGHVEAVNDVSLQIEIGEVVVII